MRVGSRRSLDDRGVEPIRITSPGVLRCGLPLLDQEGDAQARDGDADRNGEEPLVHLRQEADGQGGDDADARAAQPASG